MYTKKAKEYIYYETRKRNPHMLRKGFQTHRATADKSGHGACFPRASKQDKELLLPLYHTRLIAK